MTDSFDQQVEVVLAQRREDGEKFVPHLHLDSVDLCFRAGGNRRAGCGCSGLRAGAGQWRVISEMDVVIKRTRMSPK